MAFTRLVVAVVAAGGLAAGATGASPPASGSAAVAAPAPVISGVVRAADTGRPLRDVTVVLFSTAGRDHHQYATTDAAGRYRATGLRPGAEYEVSFLAGERNPRYLSEEAPGVSPGTTPAVPGLRPWWTPPWRWACGSPDGSPPRPAPRHAGRRRHRPGRVQPDVRAVQHGPVGSVVGRPAPGRYRVLSTHPSGALAGYYPGGRSAVGTPVFAIGSRGRTGIDLRQPAPTRLVVNRGLGGHGPPGHGRLRPEGDLDRSPVRARQGTHPHRLRARRPLTAQLRASDGVYVIGVAPGRPSRR
jgi:hypothetical protein